VTTELYHYTCRHRAALIGRVGMLFPTRHPMLGPPALVWLTDMDVPDAQALGLTSVTLKCDRTEVRYAIERPGDCIRWIDWSEGRHVLRSVRSELSFGHKPAHWWVSEHPVKARRS